MIHLATVFPAELNLNGDQANVRVLEDFLTRVGHEVKVTGVTSARELASSKADLVFIGHGSAAAHDVINDTLAEILENLKTSATPTLLVGSSVEFAVEQQHLAKVTLNRGLRESEFSVGEIEGIPVLGYRNTDSGLANIWQEENFIFCMLHGPVLAKNPKLLAWLASQLAPVNFTDGNRGWFLKLDEVCQRIWELETEVTYPKLLAN